MATRPTRDVMPKFRARMLAAACLVAPLVAHAAAGAGLSVPAALVEQGHQVALAADCLSCHTQPGGRPFSGGAALVTPFGKLYPPNITPDAKTGLGAWSEADFQRALREGVRRDGALLYPAMPYGSYTKMSDADVHALWTYLQSVPAVAHTVPENSLRFPMNLRPGLAVWRSAYFTPGRFTPTPGKSEPWNRGAYLVEALGHCGDCHTPRNIAQATQEDRHLSGALIEGWYAPDISSTPLSNLAGRSVDELAAFLKTGRMPGNVNAFGPMREVIRNSLSKLGDDDLHAIATYLKDQPGPIKEPQQAQVELPAERLAAGKAVYEQQCSTCHQADGKGVAGTVPALAGNSAVGAREPFNVVTAVLQGFGAQGRFAAMPSFAGVLDDQQVADVANYVRSAWGGGARGAQPATAWTVVNLRPVAQAAAAGDAAGLVCPALSQEVLRPATRAGDEAWRQSATDPARLQQLVHAYRAARPKASSAQVIEALSTAYCRALVADHATTASAGAKMALFSQQVATVLVQAPGAGPHGHAAAR